MAGVLIVYAFDPVGELGDALGILVLPAELAARLVAERRVELMREHAGEALRYVSGSLAHEAARQALRMARAQAAPTATRARKAARLESPQ